MYRSNLLFLYLHLVLLKGLLFCPVVCHALAFSSGALAAQAAVNINNHWCGNRGIMVGLKPDGFITLRGAC